MEFEPNLNRLNNGFKLINFFIPQSYYGILRSIEEYMESYDDRNFELGISTLNMRTRSAVLAFRILCIESPNIDMNLLRTFSANLAKLTFLTWRIDPENWYIHGFRHNFVRNEIFPPSLETNEWKRRMNNYNSQYEPIEDFLNNVYKNYIEVWQNYEE